MPIVILSYSLLYLAPRIIESFSAAPSVQYWNTGGRAFQSNPFSKHSVRYSFSNIQLFFIFFGFFQTMKMRGL